MTDRTEALDIEAAALEIAELAMAYTSDPETEFWREAIIKAVTPSLQALKASNEERENFHKLMSLRSNAEAILQDELNAVRTREVRFRDALKAVADDDEGRLFSSDADGRKVDQHQAIAMYALSYDDDRAALSTPEQPVQGKWIHLPPWKRNCDCDSEEGEACPECYAWVRTPEQPVADPKKE